MTKIKLSPRQMEVLKWLAGGHFAYNPRGNAFYINGRHTCNASTIGALKRRNLIETFGYQWIATDAGKARDAFISYLGTFNHEDGSSPIDYLEIGYGEYGPQLLRTNTEDRIN